MKKGEKITRKEAIKKVGLTALATSTLFILESKAQTVASCPNHDYSHNHGGN